ncbi:MAG: regulatory iron-sulfur-containing complex subunit RicT [Spirochaetia bacterium]|jgi:cell fate regulator YaaT (PSP1 superfamily)|nr:regulatory iron-sulfur-containing complex subunit RicT [Spirochaetia bacterium]
MSDNIDNQQIEEPVNTGLCSDISCGDNESYYCTVKILHSSETQVCRMESAGYVKRGDFILINSRYGKDLAIVLGPVKCICKSEKDKIEDIIRIADEKDISRYENNLVREKEALKLCKLKIIEHNLDMKLISSHYLLEESKILFFFTAESRVDFRDLVKNLVSIFKMRIELRQIGVRDESRVLGGLAVCGRNYCCNGVTDKLKPVSIKMAKEQNLSLNSMKISGPCGRLLCCLSYEYDFYLEEKHKYPSDGSRVFFEEDQFKVLDNNVITQKVSIVSTDGRFYTVPLEYLSKKESGKWSISKAYFDTQEKS